MALILTGILGETKGKIGPVIAQTWKGKNYIRSYRKPIDRKSEDQLARRALMTFVNDIGKYNYQTLIKPAMTGACVGQQYSPWNLFYKLNSGDTNLPNTPVNLAISYGTAPQLVCTGASYNYTGSQLFVGWSTVVPVGCSADDLVYAYMLPAGSNTLVKISPDGLKRSAGVFIKSPVSGADCLGNPLFLFTHGVDGNFSPSYGKIIVNAGAI
ncbi:MAG: hypothetical protein PHX50_15140 [Massilibacteroides sp.]|nr:hypothetical protein [Massilibacteroides sp.]